MQIRNSNGPGSANVYCTLATVDSVNAPAHIHRFTQISGTIHFTGEAQRSDSARYADINFKSISELEEFLLNIKTLRNEMRIAQIQKDRIVDAYDEVHGTR